MEIKETKELNTAMVRLITPAGELPNVIGGAYGEIAAYMENKGMAFAGPPFVIYHNMDMEALDVEIGFPVARVIEGEGRVKPGKIQGGRVASAMHTGPYETLENTYTELMDFVKEKGLTACEWMYETYLNSPEDTAIEDLKTEIFFPLKD